MKIPLKNLWDVILSIKRRLHIVTYVSAQKAYNENAEHYFKSGVVAQLADHIIEINLKKIDLKDKVILDFGAGTGRYLPLITQLKGKWIGCDTSQGMITELKKKFPNAETFININNQLDPLSDNQIDVIFSSLTLGYIKNLNKLFKEWNRVIRSDGNIVLVMIHPILTKKANSRSLKNENGSIVYIKNYYHNEKKLLTLFTKFGWHVLEFRDLYLENKPDSPILLSVVLHKKAN